MFDVGAALQSITTSIKNLFSSLPFVIIVMIILAFVVVIVTILVVHISVKRAERRADASIEAKEATDAELARQDRLPFYGGWLSTFLTRRGYIKVSDLSVAFLKMMEFLHKHLDHNPTYRLPWYLVVGPSDSGKTTWLDAVRLEEPFGEVPSNAPYNVCHWRLFSKALMTDVRGSLFLRPDGSADDRQWRQLLTLLTRYRSARPLNGIVLTLPITDIFGRDALSNDALAERALKMRQRLLHAQHALGVRTPIYVVFTKLDAVPGFQSMCQELPLRYHHQMLGWSSPYVPHLAYTNEWMVEAWQSIHQTLEYWRRAILTNGSYRNSCDGVFVFPEEMRRLQDRLSFYLNDIFKPDGIHSPLVLRGFYFTGDSGMQVATIVDDIHSDNTLLLSTNEPVITTLKPPSAALIEALPDEPVFSRKPELFFAGDMLGEKIAPEYGLAMPLQQRMVTLHRGLNVAKGCTAAFIVVGAYGLFQTYDTLTRSRDQIVPMLSKIDIIIRDLAQNKLYNTDQTSAIFDAHAHNLMQMMQILHETRFASLFVPPSWMSSLPSQMNETLKVAYQHIVVRTLYIDLLLKAREIFHRRPTEKDASTSLGPLLTPMSSPEFLCVQNYVNDLNNLMQRVEQFNGLKTAADPKDLDDLVFYTFKTRLPAFFLENYGHFRSFLKDSRFPPIDLKPYTFIARETLNVLFQNFLNALGTVTYPKSIPGRIQGFLTQLSEKDKSSLDLDQLRQFSLDLTGAVQSWPEAGKTWLDAEYFNPSKDLDALYDKIDVSVFFGKEVSQYLVDQTAISFQNLKRQLTVINQVLSDYPADPKRALKDARGKDIPLSNGIIHLEKSLTGLFGEPYMAVPLETTFNKSIPAGKMIYWDSKMISLAHDMAQKFEDFAIKKSTGLPPILHENLMLLARHSLQLNIISLVGRAQNFVDYRIDPNDPLAAEEILRTKINEMKDSIPHFLKLLQILSQGAVGHAFIELRTLLINSHMWLMQQVDRLMSMQSFYGMRDPSLVAWNGKSGLAFLVYTAKDTEDLRQYLSLQRQKLTTLALEFGRPLVMFLGTPLVETAIPDPALVNKWRRIVEQMEAYQHKQPNNSVAKLEDFIALTMAQCDVNSCLKDIKLTDIQKESGDYFLETLRQLRKNILKRSEILKRQENILKYEDLANTYNTTLKGTFPFLGKLANETTPEAEPTVIREFFEKFMELGGSAEAILDQIYQLGIECEEAFHFLQRLSQVRYFFQSFASAAAPCDVPTFDVEVDFRVNRSQSVGDDLIVDWTFKPNDLDTITRYHTVKRGTWTFGQSVELGFRWPNGDSIPVYLSESNDMPELHVNDRTATFRYTGQWSLLWLLMKQGMRHKQGYIVGFKIPTGQGQAAKVYNEIRLLAPSSNPKKPGKPLPFPEFPQFAPDLPQKVRDVLNKSPLADGTVTPYTPKPLVAEPTLADEMMDEGDNVPQTELAKAEAVIQQAQKLKEDDAEKLAAEAAKPQDDKAKKT